MSLLRNVLIFGLVFVLSIARAYAVQINLSGDNIDRYFQILEQYVLPLMVVSTVVLFCGYLASRIYHRTVTRRQDEAVGRSPYAAMPDDETAVFLRELKSTPPIEDPEPVQEPRSRSQHPLLRRRSAARAARKEALDATPAGTETEAVGAEAQEAPRNRTMDRPLTAARSDQGDTLPDAGATAGRDEKGRQIPRLQAAFRRPSRDASDSAETSERGLPETRSSEPRPAEPRPSASRAPEPRVSRPQSRPEQDERPDLVLRAEVAGPDDDTPVRASSTVDAPVSAEGSRREPPPVSSRQTPSSDPGSGGREEPTVSVVQALKNGPPLSASESRAARARAGEIIDSLDYIASVLQQDSALLSEKVKNKEGLTIDDVRELRISGFDEPQNVLEELHKLGGDAAQEVLEAYRSVSGFNGIVRRLEQMAETETLDEGWNDLVRARVSDTIYAVGQVRKTLGIYRRAVKKPANAETKPEALGGTSEGGASGSVPIGRRQI